MPSNNVPAAVRDIGYIDTSYQLLTACISDS